VVGAQVLAAAAEGIFVQFMCGVSAVQSEPDFELAVTAPAPVVSTATADVVTGEGTIGGDLKGLFATGTPVSLSLDGHANASTTADSGGDWSFSLTGLADGVHSYAVTAGSGHSTASTSGTLSVGRVTVTGTAQVGKTLTADVTGVPSDGTVAYQWNENGEAVHTGQTYLIAGGDVGQKLTSGTWNPVPAIKIQWYANGKPVPHATGASLKLTTALKGKTITVAITASKAGYVTATVRLAENTKVKAG
jgi:hypothetical protein